MHLNRKINIAIALVMAVVLASCGASGNKQGYEYAPQMYHSVAYEPLKQVTNKEKGTLISNRADGIGEFYNSNPNNPHAMNMRMPVPGTVKRTKSGVLPSRLPKDSLALAARILKNPLDSSQAVLANGKVLYTRFCNHCHGATGQGDGKVAGTDDTPVFAGIANLTGAALKDISEGHIFHVVTHGKGLMGAHSSQLNPEERWAIAKYVKTLQK